VKLFHGTSSIYLDSIKKIGLKRSLYVGWAEKKGVYFTTDYDLARIYAMQTAYGQYSGKIGDKDDLVGGVGGKPIVIICDYMEGKVTKEDEDVFVSSKPVKSNEFSKIIFCRVRKIDFDYIDLVKYDGKLRGTNPHSSL
jgi:hypothetical protein